MDGGSCLLWSAVSALGSGPGLDTVAGFSCLARR